MFGAIAGDIIGSVFEGRPIKTTDFPLFGPRSTFTDDTVLTVAIADAILRRRDYAVALKEFGRRYPDAGYGGTFYQWLFSSQGTPYGSFGNGAAMRVGPVGLAFDSIPEVLREAERTAAVTHDHPQGIQGAQATALAVFLARTGETKEQIKKEITHRFGYDLTRSLDDIRPGYRFDVSCRGSVPESLIAFLEAENVEGAIRNAVSLGGDSDTMACIAGGIAEAYYKEIPPEMLQQVRQRLPKDLLTVVDAFHRRYGMSTGERSGRQSLF